MNNTNEIWKDIPGYETLYQASNLGRVRSLKRKAPRILKLTPKGDGYLRVNLYSKEGKLKNWLVNRIIALTFIPNPENKPTVDHINMDKHDNRIENLRWATNSE